MLQNPGRYYYKIPAAARVRFILGMSPPVDLDRLSHAELKSLVIKLLGQVTELQPANAALRDEIARLKGGPTKTKLTIHEEKTVKVAAPPGSRFKGYTSFVVQDLILRPHVVDFRY